MEIVAAPTTFIPDGQTEEMREIADLWNLFPIVGVVQGGPVNSDGPTEQKLIVTFDHRRPTPNSDVDDNEPLPS